MNCPNCNNKITWKDIAFALFPVLIECKSCKEKLVGSSLIKLQAIEVLILGILACSQIPAYAKDIKDLIIFCLISGTVIAAPNVYVTLRFGKYLKRNS
jgi:hypothetical protein